MRQILRNATIIDGIQPPFRADLSIRGDRIERIGAVTPEDGDVDLDCSGRLVMPGFIDAHSHADGVLFDEDVQLAFLRQGVTTVVGGQDGVSFAPGDGSYATEYFAAINGNHPSYHGTTVSELLASYDGTTRLNFAYLVPAGTVRHEVMGLATGPADVAQLSAMQDLVADGIRDGAYGLSTGLDYVPGIFSDARELAALCEPVAKAGAVYVTHMRGGYEANSAKGLEEIASICHDSGVRAHISHFHAEADTLLPLLTSLQTSGVDVTFDAYPYTRGCTLLAMPLLPPALAVKPLAQVLDELTSPSGRESLRANWFPAVAKNASLGPEWPSMITLGHIAAPEYAWAHGLTIAEASASVGRDAIDFALDLLVASRLEVNAIMAVRYKRLDPELGRIFSSTAHIGGSDGIFVGASPHPRARGTFARYLRVFVRELEILTWSTAARHLSGRAAERFGLGDRGVLRPGAVADLAILDGERISDRATYARPLELADGVDDVFVAGLRVLAAGALTSALPGRGLRRTNALP